MLDVCNVEELPSTRVVSGGEILKQVHDRIVVVVVSYQLYPCWSVPPKIHSDRTSKLQIKCFLKVFFFGNPSAAIR